ncbi:MAG: hypothetical protein AAF346_23670 [Pseudomonadota bacterium]
MSSTVWRFQDAVWGASGGQTSNVNWAAWLGLAAMLVYAASSHFSYISHVANTLNSSAPDEAEVSSETAKGPQGTASQVAAGSDWMIGGYGGVAHTHPTEVHIVNPGRTDFVVKDFGWIGRPFKAPVYYGVRVQRWPDIGMVGSMLDFTHAKAISKREDIATFSGTHEGKKLPEKQKMGDFFRHLEFSHGHNMLTMNGLLRLSPVAAGIRPYVGVGAGVSLPHTEVGIRAENARTYEYQFAGFVGQALAGVEVQLGRSTLFLEYKFTYAPYDIPLSHEPRGWLLVTDLWRQFTAWWNGEVPPGGRLTTTLISHHGIGGVMFHTKPTPAPRASK